jgi:hypothetical protein
MEIMAGITKRKTKQGIPVQAHLSLKHKEANAHP